MFDLDSLVSVYEIVQRQKQYCEEEHCIKLAKLPASSIEPRPVPELISWVSEWVRRKRNIDSVSNGSLRRKALWAECLLATYSRIQSHDQKDHTSDRNQRRGFRDHNPGKLPLIVEEFELRRCR